MKARVALLTAVSLVLPLAHVASAGRPAWQSYPVPSVTGKQLADRAIALGNDYPARVTGTPVQLLARDELAAELRGLGYAVEVERYAGVLEAITATKKGTSRSSESIVFGGHFDVLPQSIKGTYDNATGTSMVLGLARAFAKVRTKRTLVFSLYNGEEEGALASSFQASAYADREVRAYLGFDMVGIAWPVGGATSDKNCLCLWRGEDDKAFDQLFAEVNHGFLRFPKGKRAVSIEGENVRNSDEASWAAEGVPTLRWAGLRKAADYPEYHSVGDDESTIDEVAGGRKFFEQGMRNTLLSAYYTAAALDAGR